MRRLQQQASSPSFVTLRTTTDRFQSAYVRVEQRASSIDLGPNRELVLDLSEREAANSAGVIDSLVSGNVPSEYQQDELQVLTLTDELSSISSDLDSRWMRN